MKITCDIRRWLLLMLSTAAGIVITGCAGPSTRVLPRESDSASALIQEESAVLEEANPYYLQEELEMITASQRYSGSRGESNTARYMQQLLTDYGYEVERQRFRYGKADGSFVTGTNVEAIRQGASPEADILIVLTHHDTAAGSFGANDNGSGTVAFLETARLLSQLDTDTQLRFVSVSGSQDGKIGARHYVETMTERERKRVIGCIEIGPVGYASESHMMLGTADGKATMLGDMIKRSVFEVLSEIWNYDRKQDAQSLAFQRGKIPSVYVGQLNDSYEAGTPLDTTEIIDIERISQVVNVLTQTISDVMSRDTPSMLAKSRFMNDIRDDGYVRTKDEELGFGLSPEENLLKLGMEGREKPFYTDDQGNRIQRTEYHMKWFDVDQIILTDYHYRDGKLFLVTLDGDGAGVEYEDMKERLTSWYGEGTEGEEDPNGVPWMWEDPVHRIQANLIPGGDGYEVELTLMEPEIQVIGTYVPGESAGGKERRILERAACFYPDTLFGKAVKITLYTDGIGGTKGYLETSGEDAGTWEIFLDYYDSLTDSGSWRNKTETDMLLAGLYGEILEKADPDEVLQQFDQQFSVENSHEADRVETGVKPGEYLGTPQKLPDFKESFALFVLTGEPKTADEPWNARKMFFYGNEKLTAYRADVRKELHLLQ